MDDVAVNKAAIIERCVRRILEEYDGKPKNLLKNLTKQDSVLLNLQRACEAAIDLAMHEVRLRKLGVPQESREAFSLLERAKIIGGPLSKELRAMVGFRNVAVHEYQSLNLNIVRSIIEKNLKAFLKFSKAVLKSKRPE